MIITLTGANDNARKDELDKLVAAFVAEHTDMALERLDGEETTADRLRESLQSLPFLTARKLVVLREPSRQKAFAEDIAAILESVAETTDVVIYEPKLDKRLVYYKTLKKQTDFREFAELDARGLVQWAVQYVKGQGGSLSSADAGYLVERVGLGQQALQQELHKLLSYDPAVSRQTITLLTEPLPQSTMFTLLDAAFAGKATEALALYKEQRSMRVEPQAILAMLAWQLHVLVVVKAGERRGSDAIAASAKLNPFVIRKSLGLVRQVTAARLRGLVDELLAIDLQLKRTALDADEALQLYILKLAA